MEVWHALNRGVDGRDIFLDDRDRARFVHDLYEFNDVLLSSNLKYRFENTGLRDPYLKERTVLVDIHGWVLMRNHYHLLLSERQTNGISLFLRKLNTGYANYFNERNKRKGALFQGRTKKVLIESHAQFLYILHYIHLNPLDYHSSAHDWRLRDKNGIRSIKEALEYLSTFRWSSYLDYTGTHNFPSILTKSLFGPSPVHYYRSVHDYLESKEHDAIENALE